MRVGLEEVCLLGRAGGQMQRPAPGGLGLASGDREQVAAARGVLSARPSTSVHRPRLCARHAMTVQALLAL